MASDPKGTIIFHAGTKVVDSQLVTSGGRVFNCTGIGSSLKESIDLAYEAVKSVQFDGMFFRKDIARCALDSAKATVSYADSGVSIDTGNSFVDAIKPLTRSTRRAGADSEIGNFGGVFDLKAAGYKDPILIASTDGVGTKLKIAIATGIHNTIGIDLVAMCVNDILVRGGEPLLFLDYFATGRLDIGHGHQIVSGIAEGCRQANCALIAGETAEMPGLYAHGLILSLSHFCEILLIRFPRRL